MRDKDYPAPDEYLEFVICSRFHKLPSELQREPARNVMRLLAIMTAEAEVAEARREAGI